MHAQRLFWIAALLATAACDRKETEAAKAAAERSAEYAEEQAERAVEAAKERAEATKEAAERTAEATKERAERGVEAIERKAEAATERAEAAARAAKEAAERREEAVEDRGIPGGPGGTPLPTAGDQLETDADRELTRQIRRDLLDDDTLSMRAHNVQIVSRGGVVTLRGEVASHAEHQAVLKRVRKSAGSARVVDHITVD